MHQNTQERSQDTKRFVRQFRSATRRKHTAEEKARVLEKVEASPSFKGKVLAKLGVSKSDYYRWRANSRQGNFENRRHPGPSWEPPESPGGVHGP